jgi:hypothetical protein
MLVSVRHTSQRNHGIKFERETNTSICSIEHFAPGFFRRLFKSDSKKRGIALDRLNYLAIEANEEGEPLDAPTVLVLL